MSKNINSCVLLLCIISVVQFHANSFLYGVNLTDGSGNPLNLTTTFSSVRVALYDQPSGGNHAYRETFLNVAVNRGTFQLEIGNNGVDANNNPNAKLPVLADQQIDPAMPGYNYIEITITSQPLGDPVILSPRAKLPVIPVSADSNKLGGLSPEEWELRILDAKSFYTDSKAAQAAKDDGDFLVKNISVDLNAENDQFILSVDDTSSSTKIYLHGLNSVRVFELDSQGSLKAQTLILRGGLGLDGYLSRDNNNTLWGLLNNTHVNLGEGSVTGNMSTTVSYAVVGGGFVNTAAGGHAVVAGGQNNTANNMGTTISGGALNISDGNYSSIGGGKSNTASGFYSVISGGEENEVHNDYGVVAGGLGNNSGNLATVSGGANNDSYGNYSSVGGGHFNTASGLNSSISGGLSNRSMGDYASIAGGMKGSALATGSAILGGLHNSAEAYASSVAGGFSNTASADFSSVGGGKWNTGTSDFSSIGAGLGNKASGLYSRIGGGRLNHAGGQESVVSGGAYNIADQSGASVSGGISNSAKAVAASVGGGQQNTASADYASIGGGQQNTAVAKWSTISGGYRNWTKEISAAIGGGQNNTAWSSGTVSGGSMNSAGGIFGTVSGGNANLATGSYSSVLGGKWNTATVNYTTILGGLKNKTEGNYSSVVGGMSNTAAGAYSNVGGGSSNYSSGDHSALVGGSQNLASGNYSFVAGGLKNQAIMISSSIGGGELNTASGSHTSLGGGLSNVASGNYATISGGQNNLSSALNSNISGGSDNSSIGVNSAIGGGNSNTASGNYSNISGGMENQTLGMYSSITGGKNNTATGNFSAILGGHNNHVVGNYSSIIGGQNLTISGDNSTAFNGSSSAASITASSVAAFLAVSVGVKTTNPTVDLHVNGTLMATTIFGEGSGITGINGDNLGDGTITASKIPQGELTGGLLSDQLILQGTLEVNGNNSFSALQVRTNASAEVSFIVSSNGYVALGTTNPSSQLTLKALADGLESAFTIVDKDTTNTPVAIYQSLDEGILSLRNSNNENIMLRANGDSFIQGGNLSLGKNTSSALLHLKANADNSSSGILLEDFDTVSEAARLWQTGGQGQFGLSRIGATNSILLRANANSHFDNGSLSINTQTTQSLVTIKSNQDGVQGALVIEDDNTSNIAAALYQESNTGHLQLRTSNTERIRLDANGNSFFDSGNFFGIGTNNPTHQLTLYKNEVGSPTDALISSAQNDARLILNAELNSGSSSIIFSRALTNEGSISFDHNADDSSERLSFQVGNGIPLHIHGNNAVSIGTIDNINKLDVEGSMAIGTTYSGSQAAPTDGVIIEGNVGIGTFSPQSKLDIEGSVAIGSTYSGASAAPSNGLIVEGTVGIGETNPNAATKLAVNGGVALGAYATVGAPENGVIVSGKVGIGTNNPSQTLEVVATAPVLLIEGTSGNASLQIDAKNNTDTSEINFHLSGNQEGSLIYDHDATPTNEMLKINVGNNDLFYFKGDGRLGIGVTDPDSSIEISNPATANLHLEGGTDAVININAKSENHYSDLDFSLDGQKQGAIRYDHNNIGTSEKLILNVDNSSPLIAAGSNQVIIGGTSNVTAQATLEVSGSVIIGSGYVGTQTPLANGLLVEGQLKAGGISIGGTGSTTIAIDAGAANESSDLDFSLNNVTKGRVRYNHNLTATSESMELQAGGSSILYVTGQSKVGVSVANPVNKLDVEGSLAVGASYSGAITAPLNGAIFEGNVGIATSITSNSLDVGGSVAIGNLYAGQFTGPTNGLAVSGSVGIGTTAPANNLGVNGSASFGTFARQVAPTNGLIVSGNLGVGTPNPTNALGISGSAAIGSLYVTETAGVANSLIIENRLGVGVISPDAAIEVSSLTTTDIHVNGGQGASLTLDAESDLHTSDINFSLDAVKRGIIKYIHDEDGLSEEMVFYTSGTVTPLILNGNNQLVIGGDRTHSPNANLEVVGSVIIGGTYSNSQTELSSGLLVEGRVGIGTSTIQPGIQMAVNGAISAGTYHAETAPANGFIISGDSAFGTNNPNGNHKLTVSDGSLCVGDDAACNGRVGAEGEIYAGTAGVIGLDYAEYFPAEEILLAGQLVGINTNSGKTRSYRAGDIFLGIISTKPGVVGGWKKDDKSTNLVGLMGQLPFSRNETIVEDGRVYTKDKRLIGTLLSTGDIYLNGYSGDNSKSLNTEIKKLKERNNQLTERLEFQENEILELRKKLNYLLQRQN